jgi:broad-specificity NMP kinase
VCVLTYVLGAPGSGKTAVAPLLRRVLPACVVLDWDAYMSPASELAGRDVRRDRSMWLGYRRLVRAVVDTIHPAPLVVLGVCTPAELSDWPIDAWILLDCTDAEQRRRLASDNELTDVDDAVADAAHYRALGLRVIDTTNRTPQTVADELARAIREVEA